MTDIHSHILPGLDDGAATLEQSLAMLRLAAESGTRQIVATPHASLEFSFDPAVVAAKIAELQAAAGEVPRIYGGCDLQLNFDNIQDALAHPERYSINGQGYLLVEFSDLLIVKSIEEIFARMRAAGLTPVITHPERNWLLQQRLEQLEAWVESGCKLQITAQSLFGRFGREARAFARVLLERNLVHFIASDAHDAEDRTPRLDEAFRWVESRYGRPRAEALLVENPQAALEGAEVGTPPAGRRRRWWFG
jgi:protein-tyrosine phosphatase